MKKIFLTPLLWCVLLVSAAQAETALRCEHLFDDDTPSRNLRFVTLNTQGFRLYRDLNPEEAAKPEHQKYLAKIKKWAATVAEIDSDVTVLQEVYSEYELEYLISEHLNDEYNYYFEEGHDGNGHVAFLVKKSSELEIEFRTNLHRKWMGKPLFSRDAPVLVIKDTRSEKVMAAIIGHHAKANTTDQRSIKLRTRQNKEIAKIAKELSHEFGGNLPVFAAGDFNADLHRDPSTQSLSHQMTDVFDLLARPPPRKRRVTFSFFNEDNERLQDQLDGIVLLNTDQVQVRRADVYRYRDDHGDEFPLPENLEERKELPSDHNPVWVDVLIYIP